MYNIKKWIAVFQAFLLVANMTYAQESSYQQEKMNYFFYNLNKEILYRISLELTDLRNNPDNIVKKLSINKIKDSKQYLQILKETKKELHKVKINFKNDLLNITYFDQKLAISEIGFDGSMIINNQTVKWNPETDDLDVLKNQLSMLFAPIKNSSIFDFLISQTWATGPVAVVLLIALVTLLPLMLIHFGAVGDAKWDQEVKRISDLQYELNRSVQRCNTDINNIKNRESDKPLSKNFENQTINFIKYFENKIIKKGYTNRKKLALFNCEIIKKAKFMFVFSLKYQEEITKTCDKIIALEECFLEHKKVLGIDDKDIMDANRNTDVKIDRDSAYQGLIDTLSGETVNAK